MPAVSKIAECLPEGYGYVLLVGVGNIFLNVGMAAKVGMARKQYGVKYPQLYHSEPGHMFNCIQRVHQNTIENNSNFLFLLMVGGLAYPKVSAAAGGVYLLARIAYAKGYYTGDPEKRRWGGFGHIADLVLLGSTASLICQALRLWPYN